MDIAIIGMAGRFPEAADVQEFYENLCQGRDSVRPYSRKRLLHTSARVQDDYEIFAFLEDIDLFDPAFFNLSIGEAVHMDPHQRMILEIVHEMFEHAGYAPGYFSGSDTGIFLADTALEYSRLATQYDPTIATGNLNPVLAGRIARSFNLRGNTLMVDTACSSSLVALHLACNALTLGEVQYAIAGGINLKLFPGSHKGAMDIGIHAPDGRTKAFAAAANGTGSGEAAGCVLLKPLRQAMQDRDNILAVIKGSAVNQDAALSGSLAAPSSAAQAEVLQKAWEKAGIDPLTLTYIEAHGTGTKLGDPIEVQGINDAFKKHTSKRHFCALSSVKTNVGHTNTAAGITSLIKAVLAVKHGMLFPSLHFDAPNPFIDFENSAVYVNDRLQPWICNGPRRAGVSAFGISGTNCHVVLEQAPEQGLATSVEASATLLWTFSARTPTALQNNLEAAAAWLSGAAATSLNDLAYTLYTGRDHYEYRKAFIASGRDAVVQSLRNAGTPASALSKKNNELVFLFSDNMGITPSSLSQLENAHPILREYVAVCKALPAAASLTQGLLSFIFQYAFFHWLRAAGIDSKTWIGNGIGETVIAVLSGNISLEAGIEIAANHQTLQSVNEESAAALVKKYAGKTVLFAEIGSAGNISRQIQSLLQHTPHILCCLEELPAAGLLHYAKTLYENGYLPAWHTMFPAGDFNKTEAPVYQFDQQRCWMQPVPVGDPATWLYQQGWRSMPLPAGSHAATGHYLVWIDDQQAAAPLVKALEATGIICTLVSHSPGAQITGNGHYTIDWNHLSDYEWLAGKVGNAAHKINGILHLAAAYTLPVNAPAAFTATCSHQWIMRSFSGLLSQPGFVYRVLTTGARSVVKGEHIAQPLFASVHGLLTSCALQFPSLRVQCIDADNATLQKDQQLLVNEWTTQPLQYFTTYRNGQRYVPEMLPYLPEEWQPSPVMEQKVCVVINAASCAGMALCQYLQSKKAIVIAVCGQEATPVPVTGITCFTAALHDASEVAQILQQMNLRSGNADTIYWLPGNHETTGTMQVTLENAIAIYTLLKRNSRQLVVFSDYAALMSINEDPLSSALSAWIDAVCLDATAKGDPVLHVKWPEWRAAKEIRSLQRFTSSVPATLQILDTEGPPAIEAILRSGAASIIVSTTNPSQAGDNEFFLTGTGAAALVEVVTVTDIQDETNTAFHQEGWSATENVIGGIWEAILQTTSLQLDDDFFDLGGHSLSATQVINRVAAELHVAIEFDDMLDHGTIRELSAFIDERLPVAAVPALPGMPLPAPAQEYYVLTHAQQRMWVLEQIEKDLTAYNMMAAYDLQGTLDVQALSYAMEQVVARHESLRTCFPVINGLPVQKINTIEASGFRVSVVYATENEDVAAFSSAYIQREAQTVFDLANGPLVRAALLQTAPGKWLLIFTVHHMVADGWSLNVMMSEFGHFYEAYVQGTAPALPPLTLQYKDYAVWLHSEAQQKAMQGHKDYWLQQFAGKPPLFALPDALPRPVGRSYGAARKFAFADSALTISLKQITATANATLFMTMLAALKALVYTYVQLEDLVIGSPVSGRSQAWLENQVGLYLNTVLVRTRFSGNAPFQDVLLQVKNNVLDAFRHQDYPFDQLLDDLKFSHDASRNALFDIGFTFNNFDTFPADSAAADIEAAKAPLVINSHNEGNPTVKADLWFHIRETAAGISICLDYNIALYSPATIDDFLQDYLLVLSAVAADPQVTLTALQQFRETVRTGKRREAQQTVNDRNMALLSQMK